MQTSHLKDRLSFQFNNNSKSEKMDGEDSNPVDKEELKVTHCDFMDDDRYVAQFLNVQDLNLNLNGDVSEEAHIQIQEIEFTNHEQKKEESQEYKIEELKKHSSFHNFQKHLVTTMRSIIDASKFGRMAETAQCEKKIWKVFMNSSKINKTLVSMAVGDLTQESKSRANQYGFRDVLRDFKPALIRQAQQNIAEEVLRQLDRVDLAAQLAKRRMKNKPEFMVYFGAFLEELHNGELDKRMAKCTKLIKNDAGTQQ